MKKLLISTDCFLPRWDGIARFLQQLLPVLAKRFDVQVLAPHFPGEFTLPKDVHIDRFPLINIQLGDIFFSWPKRKRVKQAVAAADIVFNQTIGPIGWQTIRHAAKKRKPIVCFVHSIEWELAARGFGRFQQLIRSLVKNIVRSLYNKCTLLLVPNSEVQDLLVQNGVTTPIKIVPLGVNTNRFVQPLSKARAKRELELPAQAPIVGFVGRIGREKDLPTLFKAFREVRRQIKSARLLIVGVGVDAMIERPNVILPGMVNNVLSYYQAMDVFVLPSLTETSSLATKEAMACGLPVIVTPVGSLREYVVDGENGLFFPRHDDSTLANNIIKLLRDDKLRGKLSRNARKAIVTNHRWRDTVVKIVTVLQKATRKK